MFETDPGVRPEDVLINLVETGAENWSFGNGKMCYDPEAKSKSDDGDKAKATDGGERGSVNTT